MSALLHLVQRGGAHGRDAASPRCTKCYSPHINGQCTVYRLHIIRCGTVINCLCTLKVKVAPLLRTKVVSIGLLDCRNMKSPLTFMIMASSRPTSTPRHHDRSFLSGRSRNWVIIKLLLFHH